MNQAVINRKIFKLDEKLKKYKTSHILHLLLSVLTAGLWIAVWLLVTISNANERQKINAEIDKLERAMWLKEAE